MRVLIGCEYSGRVREAFRAATGCQSRPDPLEWAQIVAPRAAVRHNVGMQHIEHQHQVALIEWAWRTSLPPASDIAPGSKVGNFLLAIPNGGRRRVLEAARLKAEGVKPGVSDLLLPLCRNGRSGFWLEMKSPGKRPTTEQRAWLERMRLAGYCAEWADDWTKAAGMLAGYIGVRAPGVA